MKPTVQTTNSITQSKDESLILSIENEIKRKEDNIKLLQDEVQLDKAILKAVKKVSAERQ